MSALPRVGGTGHLAGNVVHFARVLRGAGIPIGTDKVADAVRVLPAAGLVHRADWHATLAALFLTRHEQQPLFDEAFEAFWRDPALEERVRAMLLPKVQGKTPRPAGGGRLVEALRSSPGSAREVERPPEIAVDATLTMSEEERLRGIDFERMTGEEWSAACALVEHLRLPVPEIASRRERAARTGRPDLARALRTMARHGGEITSLPRRARERRAPPLVVLCDISGSMHRYTRMFLHFLHALARRRGRVSTLLFGTRLTNVTRALRDRDVDDALARVAGAAQDWAGGTRIAACLHEFNFHWARRLLGQNACVVLLTDGLERGDPADLAREMHHLRRNARRIVWLNPLLRYAGFEPRAGGIAAMRPHVDAFVPMYNLATLRELAVALR